MYLSALLTSAGINIAVCVVIFSLYSVLRKQPRFINVYFGQRLAQVNLRRHDPFCFERLVPSAGWILRAWEATGDQIYSAGGLDAVVFLRLIVFSIRIFSLAATICLFLVLPLNYFGREMEHKMIPAESLEVFSIANVEQGSRRLWAHCLALYIITLSTCALLYYEYRNITKMRLSYITQSLSNPSHFTVLVRGIPWSPTESYSETVAKFFTTYYASSYLSHQMICQSGTVQKLMHDAGKMYKMLKTTTADQHCARTLLRCGFCGGTTTSFKILAIEAGSDKTRSDFEISNRRNTECAAALVFFRTRYAALVASQSLQSPNPMKWVTDRAPDPKDVYWTNLGLPYRLLWIRKIAILVVSMLFVAFFLVPVTLTQSLVNLDKLQNTFPFLRGVLKRKFMSQLATGYLPSVILMLFLYIAPPVMLLFSTMEGAISRSGRKMSACMKLMAFMIWNVFFANILTGTIIKNLVGAVAERLSDPKNIPNELAVAIPTTATFFMTYVLTSGWASLAFELLQPLALICNFIYRYGLRNKDETTYGTWTFPYHTEVPRVVLFGVMGFTCSVMAPLILPFLLVYFFLAYLVYKNQILNVYVTNYQTGGLYWPTIHNATIFSLVITQVIASGVFGIKKSTVALSFTFPLIICTLLFNQYCRQRFLPVFKSNAAKVLIEMDWQDEQSGKMEEIHRKLQSEYCQFKLAAMNPGGIVQPTDCNNPVDGVLEDPGDTTAGKRPAQLSGIWVGHSSPEIREMEL
ncbi:OLC1v1017067C1 [Oldenlandia corymbosa var. corymbosa]|uniref:OLC1v1017067C1 n=1 Tax=Oldenlandia corymbosa var. corymbosa TaxID=529605 RepID=A0AAV1E8K2_OLDCO|nr:OLC1v1017067C1 [Oldenlandia corymbosa var. corymbosa]